MSLVDFSGCCYAKVTPLERIRIHLGEIFLIPKVRRKKTHRKDGIRIFASIKLPNTMVSNSSISALKACYQ